MRVLFYLRRSRDYGELRGFEEFHFKDLITQLAYSNMVSKFIRNVLLTEDTGMLCSYVAYRTLIDP